MARIPRPYILRSPTREDGKTFDLPDLSDVRVLARDGQALGAFRALRHGSRLVVDLIRMRPGQEGLLAPLLRLIRKQADASRFPVELHIPITDEALRLAADRLGFRYVEADDVRQVVRFEGRRTRRHRRSVARRLGRPSRRRELTLGPHEWLLLAGSVLAGQQMAPLGVTTAIGMSVLVGIALLVHAWRKKSRHGALLVRVGWITRATAIILGIAFLVATFTLLESEIPGASRASPLAAGLALLYFLYAPRTLEIRRRGLLLPFRRGWVSVREIVDFSWAGENDDELVIEFTPDPETGLPRVYRRTFARSRIPTIGSALEMLVTPEAAAD